MDMRNIRKESEDEACFNKNKGFHGLQQRKVCGFYLSRLLY